MKAKIKHTQQIIDVEWNIRGWIWDSPNGKRLFAAEELVFFDSDNIDWQSFRAEAAKDILCVVFDKAISCGDLSSIKQYPELIRESIVISDELIRQLKGKEEK